MIQLNRLEGFYWVARTGGYSRAAREFPYPITQPAVHQQVKKLEQEVGAPLFERVGKDRMVLTPEGRALYEFVAPFYTGLEPLVRALRGGACGGELRVGTTPLFLRGLLPDWLRRMQKRHPEVRIDLVELPALDAGALRKGETDLVIGYLPQVPKGVETRTVAHLHPFLVVPADHAAARRKRLGPAALKDETFVAHVPGSRFHDLQLRELARRDVRPERLLTTTSVDSILGFVGSGLGWSLVPSLDPKGPRARGVASRAFGGARAHARYPVVAAWRRSGRDNPCLRAMLDLAPEA